MEIKTYKKVTTKAQYTDPDGRTTTEEVGTVTIKTDTEYKDFDKYHLWQTLEEEQRKVWHDSHRVEDIEVLESNDGQAFLLQSVYNLER
jgi:hypothetical protein